MSTSYQAYKKGKKEKQKRQYAVIVRIATLAALIFAAYVAITFGDKLSKGNSTIDQPLNASWAFCGLVVAVLMLVVWVCKKLYGPGSTWMSHRLNLVLAVAAATCSIVEIVYLTA